jgi:hypothetical protein
VDFSQRAHSTHNQIKRFRLCSYGYGFALNRASFPQSTLQGISKNGKVTVDKKRRYQGFNPVFRCNFDEHEGGKSTELMNFPSNIALFIYRVEEIFCDLRWNFFLSTIVDAFLWFFATA